MALEYAEILQYSNVQNETKTFHNKPDKKNISSFQKKKGEQSSKGGKGKSGKLVLKTPKGTRDYGPSEMAVRNQVGTFLLIDLIHFYW